MSHKDLNMRCLVAHSHWNKFRWAGYAYYDKLRLDHGSDAHKKQTWIVKIDPSDGTFLFESTYWNKGNYLNGNEGYWLYCDRDGSQSWWNLTSVVSWTRKLQSQKELSYFESANYWNKFLIWYDTFEHSH